MTQSPQPAAQPPVGVDAVGRLVSELAVMMVVKSLRAGNSLYIPSLDITLTAADLAPEAQPTSPADGAPDVG